MYSLSFPTMFTSTTTLVKQDKEAIKSNMFLLLASERETLFGDPYFGSSLKKYLFEQSNSIVVDILIDEIYTTIATFMPQVFLTRKNIKVYTHSNTLYVSITYTFIEDNTTDLFEIPLVTGSEN